MIVWALSPTKDTNCNKININYNTNNINCNAFILTFSNHVGQLQNLMCFPPSNLWIVNELMFTDIYCTIYLLLCYTILTTLLYYTYYLNILSIILYLLL